MNRIPLPYCIDAPSLFERLRDLPEPVFLHRSDRTSAAGRYDLMAADPIRSVAFQHGELRVGATSIQTSRPLDELRAQFRDYDSAAAHFRTGFVGYFGYGLEQKLEGLPSSPIDVTGMPIPVRRRLRLVGGYRSRRQSNGSLV